MGDEKRQEYSPSNPRLRVFMDNFRELTEEIGGIAAMSHATGLSQATIRYWFNGKRTPDASNLITLSQKFGVSIDSMLGLIGKENATNDEMLRRVSEYTGLSNNAVINILEYNHSKMLLSGRNNPDELNKILSSSNLRQLLNALQRLDFTMQYLEYELFDRVDESGNKYLDIEECIPAYASFRLSKFEAIEAFSSLLDSVYHTSEMEKRYEDATTLTEVE